MGRAYPIKTGRKKSVFAQIVHDRWLYAALTPTFLFIFIFLVYPAISAFVQSLYYWKLSNYTQPRFVGLQNYVDLFHDGMFWKSFGVLAVFIVWGFVTTFFIVMPVTYLVNRLGEGGWGSFVKKAYVIPMTIPGIVFTLFWKFFYESNYGMLNNILSVLGLESLTHVWLGEEATALPALLFMNFPYIGTGGFGFLILLAGFQAIDRSLHESAELDGASAGVKFLKIDIPLIIPQIKILMILGMIGGIQQFSQQFIMTQGGPNYSTTVPGLMMFQNAFLYSNYGYGASMGVALFAVIMLVTVVFQKYIKKAD